jgi:hypothetical protein
MRNFRALFQLTYLSKTNFRISLSQAWKDQRKSWGCNGYLNGFPPRWMYEDQCRYRCGEDERRGLGGGDLQKWGGCLSWCVNTHIPGIYDPTILEAMACREAPTLTEDLQLRWLIETDCLVVVNHMRQPFAGSYNNVFAEIEEERRLLEISFILKSRYLNREAHRKFGMIRKFWTLGLAALASWQSLYHEHYFSSIKCHFPFKKIHSFFLHKSSILAFFWTGKPYVRSFF